MKYLIIIADEEKKILRHEVVNAPYTFNEEGRAANDIYTIADAMKTETENAARSVVIPLDLYCLAMTRALSAAKTAAGRGGKAKDGAAKSAADFARINNGGATAEEARQEANAARVMHRRSAAARDFAAQKTIFPDLRRLAAAMQERAATAEKAEAARADFARLAPFAFEYHAAKDAAAKGRKDARNAERAAAKYTARAAERRENGEEGKAAEDEARAEVWNAKREAAELAEAEAAERAAELAAKYRAELAAYNTAAELAALAPFDFVSWLYNRGAEVANAERAAKLYAEAEARRQDAAAAWNTTAAAE